MSKLLKTAISIVLSISLCLMAAFPVSAARPGTAFLSELHMAEASTPDAAKKLLTDKGFTVYEKNLNPLGSNAVYLGYKTSTNVEDAITDISVMNMNGGYSINNYEEMLKESFNEYKETVNYYRIAAKEYAENYKAGKRNALLAYRQLNYYVYEKVDYKITMGEYFLGFPQNDDDFADILMKGNPNILGNIRSLLAMGVGVGDIVQRTAAAAKNSAVYDKVEYYDVAVQIANSLSSLAKSKEQAEADIESINNDDTLTEDEKNELLAFTNQTITRVSTVEHMLKRIPYGDATYYEYVTENKSYDYSAFYPFVEVMTEGQRALTLNGQFIPVLIYDEVEMSAEKIEEKLSEIEGDLVAMSVFFGSDLDMFEGSFAVTEGAIDYENASGLNWLSNLVGFQPALAISTFFTAGGLAIAAASSVYLSDAVSAYNEAQKAMDLYRSGSWDSYVSILDDDITIVAGNGGGFEASFDDVITASPAQNATEQYANSVSSTASTTGSVSSIVGSSLGLALGLALMAFGIYNVVTIINSLNVNYTDIPVNMIECVETENGDRFIRYNVVNTYYTDGDEVLTKAGDTNGYQGTQWNAIYYTKNFEAGKCMLATADWPSSETEFGSYAPVHPFGKKTVCYNLLKHNVENTPDELYLSFRTSNAQKAAASDVPTVVGSLFNYGLIALSGVTGICIGMGAMALIKRKKKEEKAE